MEGFPGEAQNLTLVNSFVPELNMESSPAGHPGEYRVVFILARPGFAPNSDRHLSFDSASQGDSHISICAPGLRTPGTQEPLKAFYVNSLYGSIPLSFKCLPNERGFMRSIETSFSTTSFNDAEHIARSALNPYLSTLSAVLSVPLHIHQLEITEVRTKNLRVSHSVPFLEAPVTLAVGGAFRDEFLWFAALFREAMNSISPMYRFLCIFKIIEGIRVRRTARGHKPVEVIPDDQDEFKGWLDAVFPVRSEWGASMYSSVFLAEALGKNFGYVIEHYLRPLRNDIGHLFDESANVRMWGDQPGHVARVQRWIPIATCIARWMMRDEFPDQFLPLVPKPASAWEMRKRSATK